MAQRPDNLFLSLAYIPHEFVTIACHTHKRSVTTYSGGPYTEGLAICSSSLLLRRVAAGLVRGHSANLGPDPTTVHGRRGSRPFLIYPAR